MTERRRRRLQPPKGFTLIELLVVIGIIAVLMSILIPVISKVRTAGFDTATTHRMQAIMSAIDAYYQANNAYPGPLADDEIYSANNPTGKAVKNTNTGSMPAGVTSTENLVLGLLGGAVWPQGTSTLNAVPGQLAIDFDQNAVGNGPTNFNVLAQGKKYGPYAEAKVCGLENMVPVTATPSPAYVAWGDPVHDPAPRFHKLYTDTKVPEFMDAFPDAMPILYLRAAGGNTAAVSIPGAPTQTGGVSAAKDPTVWDPTQLQAYPFPASAEGTQATITTSDDYAGNGGPPLDPDVKRAFDKPHYYFTQGADHLTPRQRGGYMLIVAGKDRKYMTGDDRINGSPVQ